MRCHKHYLSEQYYTARSMFINKNVLTAQLLTNEKLCQNETINNGHHNECREFMKTSSNGNIFRITGLFVRGIHRSHKDQWRVVLMFSLICDWTNGWGNNRDDADLRRNRAHYDATVMLLLVSPILHVYFTNSGALMLIHWLRTTIWLTQYQVTKKDVDKICPCHIAPSASKS